MRLPFPYALSYPARLPLPLKSLNLADCGHLDFLEPDYVSFPALKMAFAALDAGGVLPAVLNSANEVAVAAFLERQITFPQIAETVARTMDIVHQGSEHILDDILAADGAARREAHKVIEKIH